MEEWSAPGSVLIAGEYRVTEEGGAGMAVAAGGRAQLRRDPTMSCGVTGVWEGGRGHWTPGTRDEGGLADAVFRTLGEPPVPEIGGMVDTRTFFHPSGLKWGFGSSAAAAVLITLYFCAPGMSLDELGEAAVKSHRSFQGGRGSGYDVLASLHGGAGAFTGGADPAWRPLLWPEDLSAWLLHGPRAVRSPGAVARYQRWKVESSRKSESLLAEIDVLNRRFIDELTADSPKVALFPLITELQLMGSALGEAVGVPAVPQLPGIFGADLVRGREGAGVKCVGAGDELTLLLHVPDGLASFERRYLREMEGRGHAVELIIDPEGIRREKDA